MSQDRPITTPPSRARAVARVRSQAGAVRTMLYELERTAALDDESEMSAQLIEELARLGVQCVEMARELAQALDSPDASAEEDTHWL